MLGVIANMTVPKVCRKVEPFCPVVGVVMTVVLVGASVAQCSKVRSRLRLHVLGLCMVVSYVVLNAQEILAAGLALQLPLIALHLVGGIAGYWLPRLAGQVCAQGTLTLAVQKGISHAFCDSYRVFVSNRSMRLVSEHGMHPICLALPIGSSCQPAGAS